LKIQDMELSDRASPDGVDWDRIERFIGYGRRDAPVVFLGMEEGLEPGTDLAAELRLRSRYAHDVMDFKEASEGSGASTRLFDPEQAPSRRTWRVMADVMLRREGLADPTLPDRRRYQALRLGRSDGDCLLAELLPYPHARSSDWLYPQRYPDRDIYEREMHGQRMELLKAVLSAAQRELIIAYGKRNWSAYAQLFPGASWSNTGHFRSAKVSGTTIILSPHFTCSRFNTDIQLRSFYDALRL
jgi:hypothetical protein